MSTARPQQLAPTRFCMYLAHLLRETPEYRQRWLANAHYSGRGRLTDGLNRTSIARVVFDHLSHETYGDTDQTVESLKHRVSRCLSGGTCHETTVEWICDAFRLSGEHREMLWSLFSVAAEVRNLQGTEFQRVGLDVGAFEELRAMRSRSRTVSAHELHIVGADRRPRLHRTLQVLKAIESGVDRYPYAFDTHHATVEVEFGGTVAGVHDLGGSIRCAEIVLARELEIGETLALEYVTYLAYPEPPEPCFRRAVAGGETFNVDMRVLFEGDPPRAVYWAEWPSIDGEPSIQTELVLSPYGSVERWLDKIENSVVGFLWEW